MSSHRLPALMLATLFSGSLAQAQDNLPRRKPGLWHMDMQMSVAGAQAMTSQHCIDERTDQDMMRRSMEQSGSQCTMGPMRRNADGWEMDATCKTPEGQMRSHMRVSGDPQSRYRMDMQSRFDPPRKGRADMQMVVQAQWKGACPAGMKPGDMRVNGMPMNPMMAGAQGGKPPAMKPEDLKKLMEQMKAAPAPQGR